jgi:hypothetical protein
MSGRFAKASILLFRDHHIAVSNGPSNNRLPEAYRDLASLLVRERYADFGPALAAEKLAEVHGCAISRETLRGWMIAAGLWVDCRHRLHSPHQPRRRRLLGRAGAD